MERTTWTDGMLDERFERLDKTLDRVDRDIREVRTDLRDLRTLLFQLWGSTMVAILGTIVTVLITNA
ncbi:MAG TPA: hypothetical protein VNO20_09385 [Solirubrobacterales bacterium]|nr:hypothetical protein [Solirubrobacterales bacterium]